jgi:hypothetical protein
MVKQNRRIISNSYLNDMSKSQREEYRRKNFGNVYSEKEADKIIRSSKGKSNFSHMLRNAAGNDRSYIRNIRVNKFETKPVRITKRVYDLIFNR